jgi:2-oxoisovalerate dehydrogenase E2 component (dihydrolipoyl transacylase)
VLVGYGPRSVVAKRRARKGAGVSAAAAAAEPVDPTPAPPTPVDPTPAPPTPAAPVASAFGAAAPQAGEQVVTPAGDGAGPPDGRVAVLAKPPVRKLARDLGVDLATVTGSGDGGVITRADVESAARTEAAPAEPAAPAAPAPAVAVFDASREQRIPIKGVRKHTATAMVASAFTAPHVTEFLTVDVTATMELRARLRETREYADVALSPLAFVAKAVCLAVRRTPEINAHWDEAAGEIVYYDRVQLGIAAATPRGLIVPKIRDADTLSLRELAVALGALTATARSGKTPPSDLAGGTFTITNVGVFGVDTGTPILNPGEAAILAVGAIKPAPWVVDGKLAVRTVGQLALSFDHRLVDGEQGSRFLADVGALLTDPGLALTW